jgi:hypothetical protein
MCAKLIHKICNHRNTLFEVRVIFGGFKHKHTNPKIIRQARGSVIVTELISRKGHKVKKSLAAIAASGLVSTVLAVANPGGLPRAAAGPDAQCQDPAYTTAIVYPSFSPYDGHSPLVACVPVSVVGHDCRAPLGEPHTLLYPLGQGQPPECRSIYGPN